jgi:transaldolase
VVYVDGLIGPTSVNTLPPATLAAFTDHGTARRTIDANPEDTARTWSELADAGIDMSEVANLLADRGVSAFVDSFDGILATLRDAAPGPDR